MPASFGRYEVRNEIGRGGMATVYRAWDPRFRREVAVKVLSSSLSGDGAFRARFEREARAVAAPEHDAIVPVYDFGEEGGDLYLVMRLLTGGSLADRVATGPLPLADVVAVVQRVAAALDHAHARGLVHRDVKPANILFDAADNAFLTDFGIARLADQTASLTGVGVVGSPAYMSPEQAEGQPLTGASDVYSLGATVYEALAGCRRSSPTIRSRSSCSTSAASPVLSQACRGRRWRRSAGRWRRERRTALRARRGWRPPWPWRPHRQSRARRRRPRWRWRRTLARRGGWPHHGRRPWPHRHPRGKPPPRFGRPPPARRGRHAWRPPQRAPTLRLRLRPGGGADAWQCRSAPRWSSCWWAGSPRLWWPFPGVTPGLSP